MESQSTIKLPSDFDCSISLVKQLQDKMPSNMVHVLFEEVVNSCAQAAKQDRTSIRFSNATKREDRFELINQFVYDQQKDCLLEKVVNALKAHGLTVEKRYHEGQQFVDIDVIISWANQNK